MSATRKTAIRPTPSRSSLAAIDLLERRALLAATATSVSFDNASGKISIVGSASADVIQIAFSGTNKATVYDGGTPVLTVDLTVAKSVTFAGGAGNDVLVMGRVPLRVYAEGGDGDDAFSTSRAGKFNDTLFGQAGNDYLYAGPGNDSLDGGLGQDGLFGAEGDDSISALSDNTGDDTISGGDGNDTVGFTQYTRGVTLRIGDRTPAVLTIDDFVFENVETVLGTSYADNINTVAGRPITVFLGGGNDIFTGGRGSDTVYGGSGRDEIATAGGDDLIVDQQGANNILNGGSGSDVAVVANATGNTETTSVERVIDSVNELFVSNI